MKKLFILGLCLAALPLAGAALPEDKPCSTRVPDMVPLPLDLDHAERRLKELAAAAKARRREGISQFVLLANLDEAIRLEFSTDANSILATTLKELQESGDAATRYLVDIDQMLSELDSVTNELPRPARIRASLGSIPWVGQSLVAGVDALATLRVSARTIPGLQSLSTPATIANSSLLTTKLTGLSQRIGTRVKRGVPSPG